jgi:hypothetical protein
MMRAPTRTAIDVAELRLSRSKENVRNSLKRTRAAIRTAATRPAALGLAVVASGLSAFWVARRLRAAAMPARKRAAPAALTSPRSFVGTVLSSYVAQVLTVVLHEAVAAWRGREAQRDAGPSTSSTPDELASVGRR